MSEEVNSQVVSQSGSKYVAFNKNFLTEINNWMKRIKFNTRLKYSFIILYFFWIFVEIFVVSGIMNYLTGMLFADLLTILVFLVGIHVGSKTPKDFQEMIIDNKNIFKSNEIFLDYIEAVKDIFKSKKEFLIPLLLGLLLLLGFLQADFSTNFEYATLSGKTYILVGAEQTLYMIVRIIYAILYCILALVAFSAILIVFNTFKCLNKLGMKQYRLNVTYKDLKTGSFEAIGRFIMKLSLPMIILSTFISIFGLIGVLVLNDPVFGYMQLGLGIVVTFIMSFLLYKNTINIHKAISKYKLELKDQVLKKIQQNLLAPPREIDYDEICDLHDFYDEVDTIYDWPFNPASIKKLTITLGSSVFPLLLSFFGIGI